MKKLNIRLLLSSCLLAWAVGVAAKGNPYQYVGTGSGSYFMDYCPYEASNDKQWMSHFVQECGTLMSVSVSTGSNITFNNPNSQVPVNVKGNVRFRDNYFRCQYISDWVRFVPTRYKVDWTLTARKGSATGTEILTRTKTTFVAFSDEGLFTTADNYSIKHHYRDDLHSETTFTLTVAEILAQAGVTSSDVAVYWCVSATITLDGAAESMGPNTDGSWTNYVVSHHGSSATCKTQMAYSVNLFSFSLSDNNIVMNVGNGDQTLVYDDPRSVVQFTLPLGDENNLPLHKSVNGMATDRHVFFMMSNGSATVFGTPRGQTLPNWPSLFNTYFAQECEVNPGMRDQVTRYQNLVLNTNGNILSTTGSSVHTFEQAGWGEAAVYSEQNGQVTITRHLLDFSYGDFELGNSTVVYVGAKAAYSKEANCGAYEKYLYTYFAQALNVLPREGLSSATVMTKSNWETIPSDNFVSFRVMPKVAFPTLTASEKAEKKICRLAHDSLITYTTDFIHLKGKRVNLHASITSETYYMPVYKWEYRLVFSDGATAAWDDLEDSDFLMTRGAIPFAVGMDRELDALVSSSVFSDGVAKVEFRQKAVLQSFSSPQRSDLYCTSNGLEGAERCYYLTVFANDVYTYSTVPAKMSVNNFSWNELPNGISDQDLVLDICTPAGANNISEFYPVAFSMQETPNLSGEEFSQVEAVAKYSIRSMTPKEGHAININDKAGFLEYYGDTVIYRCNIAVCGNNYFKDIQLNPAQIPTISLDGTVETVQGGTKVGDVTVSGGFVAARDLLSSTKTLYVTAEKGKLVGVSLDNSDNTISAVYYSRRVVPYIEPDLEETDFNSWSYELLLNYCQEQCGPNCTMNFALYGPTQLADIAKQYETNNNNALIEAAIADSIDANKWTKIKASAMTVNADLVAYNDTIDMAVFFLKKENSIGCVSDSVRVEVNYTDPISGNNIFLNRETLSTEAWISSDDKNPVIYGSLPEGGFGMPDEVKGTVYSTAWYYYDHEFGQWTALPRGNATIDSRALYNVSTEGFYLPAEVIQPQKDAEGRVRGDVMLRRVVTSSKVGSPNAIVVDSSNIVRLKVLEELTANDFEIGYAGQKTACTGGKMGVSVKNAARVFEFYNGIVYHVVDDDFVEVDTTTFAQPEGGAVFSNLTRNFHVNVYLTAEDNGQTIRTNVVTLFIPVKHLEVDFGVLVGTVYYERNAPISIHVGQRVRLINKSYSEDGPIKSMLWTLAYHDIDGHAVPGTTSTYESPACYLYNNGENKISLEVATDGCFSTADVTINVAGKASLRRMPVFTDGSEIESYEALEDGELCKVFPTVTDGPVTILTNLSGYDLLVTTMSGRVVFSAEGLDDTEKTIDLGALAGGVYLVRINNEVYKVIKK